MPTANEYKAANTEVWRLINQLRGSTAGPVNRLGGAGLTGGLVAAQVDELVKRRHTDAQVFAQGLAAYSAQLQSRQVDAQRLDVEWRNYDTAYDAYRDEVTAWESARDLYVADPVTNPYPGAVPTAPTAPTANPDWYQRTA